jgi:hypothetical protein
MTDKSMNEEQKQELNDAQVEQVEAESPVASEEKVEEVETKPVEEHEGEPIPRKLVTEIVRRERANARQKERKRVMAELGLPEDYKASSENQPQIDQSIGGMPHLSEEKIQRMIDDAASKFEQKRHQESQAAEVVNKFVTHMQGGKDKYEDFEDKMKNIEFGNIPPQIVHFATETGIPEDIFYDLAENPQKIAHLTILAHTQPALLKRELEKLSASIKTNQSAKQQVMPREPLSQITPSNVGSKDTGNMSVRDFQKMFSG